jgi:Skp family chaperone for outer membrane proteins
MLRICLIIAIVGALAAGVINFVKVKQVIDTLVQQRNEERSAKETAQAELSKTKKDLAATKKDLEGTKSKLQQTTSELAAANEKVTELDKHSQDLTAQLNKTRDERDKADQELAQWSQLSVTPPQVKEIMENLKKITTERDALTVETKMLTKKRNELQAKLDEFIGTDVAPPLPAGLKGKVLVVDPKYDFVVLNIGEDQGVLRRGEMLVDHEGKLIAKVRIASVQKDRCIANIMPGWTRGEVMEGDEVLY